ncbi:hypothetical protein M7I_4260 [Glarea lozoyensis 74030]|uniref:Uncharacterized protein n=1 Tax=Glarea lozoyensis (strain ATCC 74030 / MF5533) TaxID=1104152 RepID=H0ENP8_GLAL7|nr:hypothetical protein M7I_4260 [Glarea lozoyensis 74030]
MIEANAFNVFFELSETRLTQVLLSADSLSGISYKIQAPLLRAPITPQD